MQETKNNARIKRKRSKSFIATIGIRDHCKKIGDQLKQYHLATETQKLPKNNIPSDATWRNVENGQNATIGSYLSVLECCGKSLLDLVHDISVETFVEFLINKDYVINIKGEWYIGPALARLLALREKK